MKNDKLRDIWKKGNSNIVNQSVEELNILLEQRIAKLMKKHFLVNYISISVGVILIILLIYAGVKKSYDTYYLINNMVLCLIIAISVLLGIHSYYKMNNNTMGLPLRDWLGYRITAIAKSQKRYVLHYLFVMVIILPFYISFFVFFISRPLIKVLMNEQFYFSFFIVFVGGSFSAFLAIRNISLYQKKILESLKSLHTQLSEHE